MSNFSNLVGLPYIDGLQDCYSVGRRYYSQVWGLELPNIARPHRFWDDPDLDLYSMYQRYGFQPVFDDTPQIGDAVLMPILSRMNNHAGFVVEDNQILHHLPNQLSCVDRLRPKWMPRVTVQLRHPAIQEAQAKQKETVHLHEVIDADVFRDPRVQEEIDRVLESERRKMRGHNPRDGGGGDAEPSSNA